MSYRWPSVSWIALTLLIGGSIATAKPAGAVKRPPTKKSTRPVAEASTVPVRSTPTGLMTPKAVVLRATTPAEAEANAIWSTRAALNVAALQCQFSPFLATVRNYNDFLRQHGEELDRARLAMTAHFRRYDGAQAQNSFDRYTTQTYNSYSTLDAQLEFCDEASVAGRVVLTVPKGRLGATASGIRDKVRAALVPVDPHAFLTPVTLSTAPLPEI